MREGQFIKKNLDKWKAYQYERTADPDETAQRFTEVVNDLGYAKTFYPHSKVTQYLNGLASKNYLDIYRNKKEESSRIITFWKYELPLVIRKHHKFLLYTFLIFATFAILAAFSAAHDEKFVRSVLGDGYVEMTEDNIAKGDPFGVYKDQNAVLMFVQIALNNIRVAFMFFVLGIFIGLFTIWLLFENGIMLGAFQYYFFAKNLGLQSVLVIWIHGTLEISAIIISGAAGLMLGSSLLFPGTYKRMHSLKEAAKDGMKIMIGLVPIFIVAALLESFVTRYSTNLMPAWMSAIVLLLSAAFIGWYFIFYPIRLQKTMAALQEQKEEME